MMFDWKLLKERWLMPAIGLVLLAAIIYGIYWALMRTVPDAEAVGFVPLPTWSEG